MKPLCPDVFLFWGENDENKNEHEEEVKQATKYLYQQVIPGFNKLILNNW
jgi:hypothetical protein